MTEGRKNEARERGMIERLQTAVELLGAHVINVTDDGAVDFRFGNIEGFAKTRRGKLRVSFFLAFDPNEGEAKGFVLELGKLPIGDLQILDIDDGTTLRHLVELRFDDEEEIRRAGGIARSIQSAWDSRASGASDLVNSLWLAGIAAPPTVRRAIRVAEQTTRAQPGDLGDLPLAADGRLIFRFGPWHWGTRYIDAFEMYMFHPNRVAHDLVEHGAFFALSHAGHGWNSYGLNLVACSGPIAVYVQHIYGGTFTNPVRDLISINATYSRLHILFGADEPQQQTEDLRWLLVYSNFRGAAGLVDLNRVRDGEEFDDVFEPFDTENPWHGDEPALFTSLVDRLGFTGFDFGVGGVPTW